MEKQEINELMDAVQVCTVAGFKPLYKNGEEALNIQQLVLEENEFTLVTQKNLYNIGDKVIYILPDYNLEDVPLFDSFTKPNGDPKKSLLGGSNRVRAKKFNFLTENGEIIYSLGIVLPMEVVKSSVPNLNLTKCLATQIGVYKKPSHEPNSNSGNSGSGSEFPSTMYKTDETNILSKTKMFTFPNRYIGGLKVDGSSITIYDNGNEHGIGSRRLLIPDKVKVRLKDRQSTFFEKVKKFFGSKLNLKQYEEKDNDSKFLLLGKEDLGKLHEYCQKNGVALALRGEANGVGWGGSGNKNNPHYKNDPNIMYYGLDTFKSGFAEKLGYSEFVDVTNALGLNRVPIVFDKVFESKEELFKTCEDYFKENLVEGIVIRNEDSTLSAKYMNSEYDSKK